MPFSGKKNEAVQLRPGIISAGQDRPKSHTDPLEQRGQPIIGVRPLSPPRSISFPIAEPDAQGNRVVPSSVAGFIDPTAPLQSPSWTDGQAAAAVLNNVATQKRQLQQASTTLLKLTPDGRPFSEVFFLSLFNLFYILLFIHIAMMVLSALLVVSPLYIVKPFLTLLLTLLH